MGDITVAVPVSLLTNLGAWLMPPKIEFGSPVQRSKGFTVSYWHIPIKTTPRVWIWPHVIPGCEIYLDNYEDNKCINRIRLYWGDAPFDGVVKTVNLDKHKAILVPVAWREESDDQNAYITDTRFHISDGNEKVHPVEPLNKGRRLKYRFKLRVKSSGRNIESPHFYLLRLPDFKTNGHFTVEIEYEGEGTQ